MDMLGRARQVKVTKENTIIVDGAGDEQAIKDRVGSDPQPDRPHHQRVRQGEAAGASGQAGRRRGRHQGGRCYRDRDEGEEAPHRGRSERHHAPLWKRASWPAAAPSTSTSSPLWSALLNERGGRRKDRRAASWPRLWRSPSARSLPTPVWTAPSFWRRFSTSGKTGYGFDAYKEEYCDMIASRHRGSRQGDPLRSGERRLRLRHGADHRVSGGRQAPAPRTRCSRSRNGRHGRYVLRLAAKP